jgi:DNA-binding GntR family transcriptional regulator
MSADVYDVAHERRRNRQPLPEEVAAYVRGLIMGGAVQPGEFLRMEPIAEAVGVSNTPVREGLLLLRGEGFVRLVPRRGFVVAPFTQQDVRDIFWAEAQLAGELAARAATKMSSEQIKRLVELHELLKEAEDDPERSSDLGHAFHREINKAADSHRLGMLLNSIVKQVPSTFYVTIEANRADTVKRHRQLVTALRRHDAERARSVMETHVLEGADYLIANLEERGIFSNVLDAVS